MKQDSEIIVLPDRAALAEQAAERFVSIAQKANAARGRFTAALSGGSTPRELYALLATPKYSAQIHWTRTFIFFGDERNVPPDHPESNYRMVKETLLDHAPVPAENVYRIRAEQVPDDAAHDYEVTLSKFFHPLLSPISEVLGKKHVAFPRFDLILLGLGANGHTASLFPHSKALRQTERWVMAEFVQAVGAYRVTLTAPVINAAENILFLVAGADKARAVHAVLRGEYCPDDFPAQLIQPTRGRMAWLLDQEASAKLEARS